MKEVLFNEALNSGGYVVDFAMGTTYNMDLQALLSVPISLGFMGELNDSFIKSPHYLLEAIRKSADSFIVFNNAGQISVPSNANRVYSLLEQSVIQITMPCKGKSLNNFHPKIWVIKETDHDINKSQLKVIVMSRNLSYSNNIDVISEFVGEIKNQVASIKQHEKHRPLRDFMIWLSNKAKGKKRKQIIGLCDCLDRVQTFNLDGTPFCDYDFFPMGIDGYNGKDTCLNPLMNHLQHTIVISPFVDKQTLNTFANSHHIGKHTLITRHNNITPELITMFNDGVYAVRDCLTDKDENDISVDIHEKVYYTDKADTGEHFMYLGSTNATNNGFCNNIEFLIRFKFTPNIMSYNKFRSEFINDLKECLFEPVTEVTEDDTDKIDITDELELRRAISSIRNAEIIAKENDIYDIQVTCKQVRLNDDINVYLYPMYNPAARQNLSESMTFKNIDLTDLTEFYVIQVGKTSRLIKIETKNLPVKERDTAIFQSIINTKEKFINYLSFMLTDDTEEFMCEMEELTQSCPNDSSVRNEKELSLNLYEDMVKLSYTEPDRIKDIRDIVEKFNKDVVPEDFINMYAQFDNAIKKIHNV